MEFSNNGDRTPSYSFHASKNTAYLSPSTEAVQESLLKIFCNESESFTIELWLNTLPSHGYVKLSDNNSSIFWIIYSSQFAWGIDCYMNVVIGTLDSWYTTDICENSNKNKEIQSLKDAFTTKWQYLSAYLIATSLMSVTYNHRNQQWDFQRNFISVPLSKQKSLASSMETERRGSLYFGRSMDQKCDCSVLLHDLRIWSTIVDSKTLKSNYQHSIRPNHQYIDKLEANWLLNSGSIALKEQDLSGKANHLGIVVLNKDNSFWCQTIPSKYTVSPGLFQLQTWQDSTDDNVCHFAIEVTPTTTDIRAPLLSQVKCNPVVFLVFNLCSSYKASPIMIRIYRWLMSLLESIVQSLPSNYLLNIWIADEGSCAKCLCENIALCDIRKNSALKVLKNILNDLQHYSHSQNLLSLLIQVTTSAVSQNGGDGSFTSIVVLNDTFSEKNLNDHTSKTMLDNLIAAYPFEISLIHLSPAATDHILPESRFYHEYCCCDLDLDWVLTRIFQRVALICCKNAELSVTTNNVGNSSNSAKNEYPPCRIVFDSYMSCQQQIDEHTTVFQLGLLEAEEVLMIVGSFYGHTSDNGLYSVADIQLTLIPYVEKSQFAQTVTSSIRLKNDISNELYLEDIDRKLSIMKHVHNGQDNLKAVLRQLSDLTISKKSFFEYQARHKTDEMAAQYKLGKISKQKILKLHDWVVEQGERLYKEEEVKTLQLEYLQMQNKTQEQLESINAFQNMQCEQIEIQESFQAVALSVAEAIKKIACDELSMCKSYKVNGNLTDPMEILDSLQQQHHLLTSKLESYDRSILELESKLEDELYCVRALDNQSIYAQDDVRTRWYSAFEDLMKRKRERFQCVLEKNEVEKQIDLQTKINHNLQMAEDVHYLLRDWLESYQQQTIITENSFHETMRRELLPILRKEYSLNLQLEKTRNTVRQVELMRSLKVERSNISDCVILVVPLLMNLSTNLVEKLQLSTSQVNTLQRLINFCYCLGLGLRCLSLKSSPTPICQTIATKETFLYFEFEQLDDKQDYEIADINVDKAIYSQSYKNCLGIILINHSLMYTSVKAMNLASAHLNAAKCLGKPIIHIRFVEDDISQDNLNPNNSNSGGDAIYMHNAQHSKNFDLLSAVRSQSDDLSICANTFGCFECETSFIKSVKSQGSDGFRQRQDILPCVRCCWKTLFPSRITPFQKSNKNKLNNNESSFPNVVIEVGKWIDELSVKIERFGVGNISQHPAPSISNLAKAMEKRWTDQLKNEREDYSNLMLRRQEVLNLLFLRHFNKSISDDARTIFNLKYRIQEKQLEHIDSSNLKVCDWSLDAHKLDVKCKKQVNLDSTPEAERGREVYQLMIQEFEQTLSEVEILSFEFEDYKNVTYKQEVTKRSTLLHDNCDKFGRPEIFTQALARSIGLITRCGRQLIDSKSMHIARRLRNMEQAVEINHLLRLQQCEQAAKKLISSLYEHGLAVIENFIKLREGQISNYSLDILNLVSVRQWEFSRTIDNRDLDRLKVYCNMIQYILAHQSHAYIEYTMVNFAVEAAKSFRHSTACTMDYFHKVYSPSPEIEPSLPVCPDLIVRCSRHLDKPLAMWSTLNDLINRGNHLIDVKHKASVWIGHLKLSFANQFGHRVLTHWRTYCKGLFDHLEQLVKKSQIDKDKSFSQLALEHEVFKVALSDQEVYKQKLILKQAQKDRAKQTMKATLTILQQYRAQHAEGIDMREKLQTVAIQKEFDANRRMEKCISDLKKSWNNANDLHVNSISQLYDFRAQCGANIEALEVEINKIYEELRKANSLVNNKRLSWLDCWTDDIKICKRHNEVLKLANDAATQIFEIEVAIQDSMQHGFDSHQDQAPLEKNASYKNQSRIEKSTTTEHLVQLCIARLDVIRNFKVRRSHCRKLELLQKQQGLEMEELEAVNCDLVRNTEFQKILLKRVSVLNEQSLEEPDALTNCWSVPLSSNKLFPKVLCSPISTLVSPPNDSNNQLDQQQTRTINYCHKKFKQQLLKTKGDYLEVKSRICRYRWQKLCLNSTIDRLQNWIDMHKDKLSGLNSLLVVLEQREQRLLHSATHIADIANENQKVEESMLPWGIIVNIHNSCSQQRWAKQCIKHGSLLSEKILGLREEIHIIDDGIKNYQRSKFHERGNNNVKDIELDALIQERHKCWDSILQTEFEILVNRLENQIADKLAEGVERKVNRYNHEENVEQDDSIISLNFLKHWQISHDHCFYKRQQLLATLRSSSTAIDHRNFIGNIAEELYGENLGSEECDQLYNKQATSYILRQWNIIYVVMLLAQIMRKWTIKKAAKKRKDAMSQAAKVVLKLYSIQQHIAHRLLNMGADNKLANIISLTKDLDKVNVVHFPYNHPVKKRVTTWQQRMTHLLRYAQYQVQDSGKCSFLCRLGQGLLKSKYVHQLLNLDSLELAENLQRTSMLLLARRDPRDRDLPLCIKLNGTSALTNSIKITWENPPFICARILLVEICKWDPEFHCSNNNLSRLDWTQTICDPTLQTITINNLKTSQYYWVRVRGGNSLTQLNITSKAILIQVK